MIKIFKLAGVFVLFTVAVLYSFAQFGHAFVDYSLESLGLALQATENKPTSNNMLGKHVYQSVLKGMILDEAAHSNMSYENLLLLEAASRSLEQPDELAGVERARFYIGQVQENKSINVSTYEKIKFSFNQFLIRLRYGFSSLIAYVKSRTVSVRKEQSFQISDVILLNRAQKHETEGDFDQAKDLYRQYLEIYRDRPDRGLVMLSLGNIYIMESDWASAKKILGQVQSDFFNKDEGRVAMSMIKNINLLESRSKKIQEYLSILNKTTDLNEQNKIRFQLGAAYLAVQKFELAENEFKALQTSSDKGLADKATFYLGWVYKLKEEHDEAGEVLEGFLKKGEVEGDMKLALQAQLADIYMQKGDLNKAKKYYQLLANDAKKLNESGIRAKTWLGLADIEEGVVSVQQGDTRSLEVALGRLGSTGFKGAAFFLMAAKLRDAKGSDLRSEGFHKLLIGETHEAKKLFEKYNEANPNDAWTYSGIATADLMLKDLERAQQVASRANQLLPDAYTTSLVGYIYSITGRVEEAITLYHQVLAVTPGYVPARYNLTCEYLKLGRYQQAYDLLAPLYDEFKSSGNKDMKSRILNNLGVALWGLEKRMEAFESFKEALRVSPRFFRAEKNMKQIRLGETPAELTEIGATNTET